ncbi:MAG: hypothetical protein IKY78_10660 [Clostridia bacterium]|nr:hypothetical protein [Clostridia bacterium]
MVDAERIKELEKLDKRLKTRRRLTIVFFVVLSFVLVLYAVSIEQKIDRLSENPAVVIYSDAAEVDSAEEKDYAQNSADASDSTNVTFAEKDTATEELQDNNSEEESESDVGQVYYVTTSGQKYHKDGCSYLTKSKREVTYDEILSGGYTACSRCIKE